MATALVKKFKNKKESMFEIISFLEQSANSVSTPITEQEYDTISTYIEELKPLYAELVNDENELKDKEVDLPTEEVSFKRKYIEAIGLAKSKLRSLQSAEPTQPLNSAMEPQPMTLPVVDIPKFSGRHDDWVSFRDSYLSLIHENKKLSNVQKFHYLQSVLKGEAASILKCLSLSEDGYNTAWDRLVKRYQNERLLVKKHVKTLLNLPAMKKGDHVSLRNLIDTVALNISALTILQRPADQWDDILIEIVSAKLDSTLQNDWEGATCVKVPTYAKMEEFLTSKCNQLEAVRENSYTPSDVKPHKPKVLHAGAITKKCVMCDGGEHNVYSCSIFLNMTVGERIAAIKRNHLCYNCLRKGHSANKCNSSMCRKCNRRHHTLLHLAEEQSAEAEPVLATTSACVNFAYTPSRVLLCTCKVLIRDSNGRDQVVRAVLDSGAQPNVISSACVKRLGLKQRNINVPITVMGGANKNIQKFVSTQIKSRVSDFNMPFDALVMDFLTDPTPSYNFEFDMSTISPGIQLADPEFYLPQDVDIFIGNEYHYDIVTNERVKSGPLTFLNTQFGWIAYGQAPHKRNKYQTNAAVCHLGINDIVSKFWEIENHKGEVLAPADEKCEQYFRKTTCRNISGRFQVALPFKDDVNKLGNSSVSAKQQFFALERRLAKHPSVYAEYRAFMDEYKTLGHMRKTRGGVHEGYYLPHHCVIKESSLTTKLRVVFNGSAPSSTGVSLNNILMVGPTVQNDLFGILARMRLYTYVITADIAKMYRQVNVREQDCKYQRIWWRPTPEEELGSYELTTLTYGTAPAAYLAIRVIKELAEREALNYPIGSDRCIKDFYVDDLITGADSLEQLIQVRDQVNDLLATGGFELKRWASNNKQVFRHFKTECTDNVTVLTRECDEATNSISTLGMIWNPSADMLSYKHHIVPANITTRRTVLSEISRIYDPLGLVGPIIIVGKIFIQDIWRLKCGWDDLLPSDFVNRWLQYANNMKDVPKISIPRMVIPEQSCQLELHGFSDASEFAYGACIYMVCVSDNKRVSSNLLCAKSRVAPVKSTSIPRLELCAAVLLAELCERVCASLNKPISKTVYYSDSSITLSWIKSESRRFKTFVANRVGEIHKLTNSNNWFHVNTKENPADIISRGSTANVIKDSKLWWHGPEFLLKNESLAIFTPVEEIPEAKCNFVSVIPEHSLVPECETYEKTVRVIAYVLRFINNTRGVNKLRGQLTVYELKNAFITVIKNVQCESFGREIHLLSKNANLPKSSKLLTLNPFLDDNGIVRVGGRLANSSLTYNKKYPIVLPSNHKLVRSIAESVHRTHLHIGSQGTLAAMRMQFWPLRGRTLTRDVVKKCIRCVRAKPTFQPPFMSALPQCRTEQIRPFLRVGVDYCGPFLIKEGSRRSKRTIKSYVCVFVCCATKAVHLELVSTLSTDGFLAAFSRFISRRGNVIEILSDNGTNFVGARNHLRELGQFLSNEDNREIITDNLTRRQILWSFIPPRAPHFGGLWEAAVKSVKCHLRRVAGNALLTAEELTTLLAQIEAVLNSRPLCSLSEDPNDYVALTPSHFLIGDVLTAPVESNLEDTPDNRLSRWELIQKMRQHIWKRWSREYLSELHKRAKWNSKEQFIAEGQLVIIKDDNLPPLRWPLGRIEALHPGADGVVRTATVRTGSTTMLRPVVKLCVLPTS